MLRRLPILVPAATATWLFVSAASAQQAEPAPEPPPPNPDAATAAPAPGGALPAPPSPDGAPQAQPAPTSPAPGTAGPAPAPPAPALPPAPPPVIPPQPEVTTIPSGLTPSSNAPDTELSPSGKKEAWVRWRGTAASWTHSVTTTALGVGRDNISGDDEVYTQGFGVGFNYFILDDKAFRLRFTTSVGFDVELTNSNTTNTEREPQFRDIPLTFAAGGLTPWKSKDGEWVFGITPNFTTILPTSSRSSSRGDYLTTSPRLLGLLSFPILGEKAPHLKNALVGASVRWDYRFGRTSTPTTSDLQRPRQAPSGVPILSDQLSGQRIGDNTLRFGSFAFLSESFGDAQLWLSGGLNWSIQYLPALSNVECTRIDTGCVTVPSDPDASDTRHVAGFSVGASFFPTAEVGFSVGYENSTLQLGQDGKRRNAFYSPDASFTADVIVSIDAIYERFVGPPRKDPVIFFGKNAPTKRMPLPPGAANLL